MKIIKLKTKSKKLSEFMKKEWKDVHHELHGRDQDDERWKQVKFVYKAVERGNVVGAYSGVYMAGVLHLSELIISKDARDEGVGTALMKRAEEDAKKIGLHLIYLETGKNWKARKFYEKLGYKVSGHLDNFYDHTDFVFMTKYL